MNVNSTHKNCFQVIRRFFFHCLFIFIQNFHSKSECRKCIAVSLKALRLQILPNLMDSRLSPIYRQNNATLIKHHKSIPTSSHLSLVGFFSIDNVCKIANNQPMCWERLGLLNSAKAAYHLLEKPLYHVSYLHCEHGFSYMRIHIEVYYSLGTMSCAWLAQMRN